jgi:glucose-6-phosphate 1-dehydrogenase
MTAKPSDAIVFFGATGDLAYKQIFPALPGLVQDEGLNIPIIGVAKAGWNLDQMKGRAVESDYNDEITVSRLRAELGQAQCPLHYLAVPPSLFTTVAHALAQLGCANDVRLVIEKPFGHNRATTRTLDRLPSQYFPEENIVQDFLRPPYQRLLGDALRGVGELYGRDDIVVAQWRIDEPIWDNATPIYPFRPGTWSPDEADAPIGADGPWRNPNIAVEAFT